MSKKLNILVTLKENHLPEIFDKQARVRLESIGMVTYRPDLSSNTSGQTYSQAIAQSNADVIVTGWDSPSLTFKIFQENPQLQYLCHVAGEVRPYVDVECIQAGLIVSNWGTVVARSVAEGALMMILAALRRATYWQMELHLRKGWAGTKHPEGLLYQRVGLLGFGAVAQELVRLIQPFECKIFAYDPYISDKIFDQFQVTRISSVAELFRTCRIVSIHAASTLETDHLVNKFILSQLEDGGVIVNTARGSIIDTEALIAELKTGRIEAGLDVFEQEPLNENSELRGLENCLLMPHLAGPTPDRWVDMGRLAIKNIESFINGREVLNKITPEKYDRMT